MSTFNAFNHASEFNARGADEYAREAIEYGELDRTNVEEWAHETAQCLDAVIYYYQALALFAAGYFDDTDDEAATQNGSMADGAHLAILNMCCALSHTWHCDRLMEAATKIMDNREYATAMRIIDGA